jgi:hypothetical protein
MGEVIQNMKWERGKSVVISLIILFFFLFKKRNVVNKKDRAVFI